ncbi:NAD(P)-binding domain-containing protein [uncultured Hoeflea sp.]|uniref:NADPH-dependent F420 reductase n=1 Tax=uncultured Hoeflea sp. TaxID=538666 RepID=UPI002623C53A|nr:NAD(P)-binding domain-containing protein [uncultured Hoeflea sp.]
MKIGIIGAGDIGSLYAKLWVEAGHEVMISARTPSKAAAAAASAGAASGTPAEAAIFGDVILLAINYWTINEALHTLGPHLNGKLVIDATNPLQYADGGSVERVITEDAIAGEIMAVRLPQARVAKAFTSLWTGHVSAHTNRADPKVAMPLAADDSEDRVVVAQLVRDAGLIPVDLGPLAASRPLDPPSPVWNVVLTPDEFRERVADFRAKGSD